ncbi:Txe/YoeB family addiction module toxin [Selenomonas sp. oral taxon 126]|uniref:Txe/YoeB family addiction module toxin n=1 Tax=Selenomonas sp. oral taxon 126 TaxID=712528 RepID=UPI001F009E02|nr:Txe/YoeB family addiction module toxin [Selenomonas sp. oral taxon 126]
MYEIFYTKNAANDVQKLKAAKLDRKARALIDLLRENPFQNPPPYEKLQGDLQGAYSRRINIKHRLVYQVLEEKKLSKSSVCGHITNSKGCCTKSFDSCNSPFVFTFMRQAPRPSRVSCARWRFRGRAFQC